MYTPTYIILVLEINCKTKPNHNFVLYFCRNSCQNSPRFFTKLSQHNCAGDKLKFEAKEFDENTIDEKDSGFFVDNTLLSCVFLTNIFFLCNIFIAVVQYVQRMRTLRVGKQNPWQSRANFARCNHFAKSCKFASWCNFASKRFCKIVQLYIYNLFLHENVFARWCKSCNFARDCKQSCNDVQQNLLAKDFACQHAVSR